MISSFSDAGSLMFGLPIPDHAFFEQSQFEGLLGNNFLEVLRFAPKLLDLVGRRRTSGVPGKPALAGLEKLLRPGVIHALGNAFAPAKLGDRGFAAKAIEHDADLLFRPMVLPSCASDVADNAFRRRGHGLGFLSHLRSLAATMSQKSSLPQAASFVSQVLKRDRYGVPEGERRKANRQSQVQEEGCHDLCAGRSNRPQRVRNGYQARPVSGARNRGSVRVDVSQIDAIGYWIPAQHIVIEPGMIVRAGKLWRPGL